ncbi:MAG: ATP-binding protein [Myxococcota bacterium]
MVRAVRAEQESSHLPHGQWLLLFRIASSLVLLVGGAVLHLRAPAALRLPPTLLFYGSLAGAFIFSLVVAGLLRVRSRLDPGILGYLQLLADVAFTTALVYATGGQDSVLTFLYPLNTLYAAALVSRTAGYTVAAVNSGAFAALAAMQVSGLLQRIDEPGGPFDREALSMVTATAGANFLVAMMGGQLSEQLRRSGETLQRTRLDLRALQSLQSAMVQSLPSGLLSVNAAGVVQLINPAAARILGLTEGQALWRPLHEMLPPMSADRLPDQRAEGEFRYPHPDGSTRQIAFAVSPLPMPDGARTGAVVVLQDVTEQRRLEAAIALQSRLATVGQFAAGLAHELRNPLGSMIGCVELLKQGDSRSGDEQRLLNIVHREAERLARLVQDFLHYARPHPPQLAAVDLDEMLREVTEDFARDPGLNTVSIRTQGQRGLKVQADSGQLRQVLWNLLRNAAQASPAGEVVVVSVERAPLSKDNPHGVRVTVVDKGPGVPPEVERALFEPFFTTKPGGTGLGLAIVHRIMEAHGGMAGLEHAGGPGAAFYVTFPAHQGESLVPSPSTSITLGA